MQVRSVDVQQLVERLNQKPLKLDWLAISSLQEPLVPVV